MPFSVLVLDTLPDLHMRGPAPVDSSSRGVGTRRSGPDEGMLGFSAAARSKVSDGQRRVDSLTTSWTRFRPAYGRSISEDLFLHVSGLLHAPDYRETYAADLKGMCGRACLLRD